MQTFPAGTSDNSSMHPQLSAAVPNNNAVASHPAVGHSYWRAASLIWPVLQLTQEQ
jgi:hypothetical protein